MAIEKGLYAAPTGLDEGIEEGEEFTPALEIEIEDPEAVKIGMDGMEIVIEPGEDGDDDFNANLAEELDEGTLTELAGDLLGDYESDVDARKEWMQTYVDGIELLGMKIEERTEPWPGACGVFHPILAEALVKFQSETIMETFPAQGPVKTKIIGKITKEKEEASIRVKDDMNYQLTDRMVEYRPEHERALWGLGLSGNAFKKVYFDPSMERQVSLYVPAEDIVVPYGASNLETAGRITHVMRKTKNELRKLMVAGFYRDIDLPDPSSSFDEIEKKVAEKMGFTATADDRYRILEMHVELDLPGHEDKDKNGKETGIALPYVVTIEKDTGEVLSIRRNWHPDDLNKTKRNHFVHYPYIPGFGFYAFGLIHLIGAFAKSGTSLIRQLVDSGTLSNLPGGFKARGLRVKGDDTPIAPAEWRDVDVPSGTIRDNILPLPYKEPSQTLFTLMNQIIQEGKQFASAADMKISDMSAQAPVGTTLAILERTMRVMSAVQARIHYAMKQEFRLLKDIIRDYTPESYDYEVDDASPMVKKSDYDSIDVIPVSDPNAATMAQRVVQYQAVLQLAQGAPQLYDLPALHRQMLEVLGIRNVDKLIPGSEDQKPRDPVAENMGALTGKPLKAFIYQDHAAHIATHMSFMQDPMTAQMIGQNPMGQQIMAALQAHIAEHYGFQYRQQIEQQLGAPLPDYDEEGDNPLTKDLETALSRVVAQAAQQLTQQNQAAAAQQQAQEQAQDPIIQMQMQELQLKGQELQRKAQKDQIDAKLKAQQQALEKYRIDSQLQADATKLGVQTVQDQKKFGEEAATSDFETALKLAELMANQQQTMKKPENNQK